MNLIRIFGTSGDGAVYQNMTDGIVRYVEMFEVVSTATPDSPREYNDIVGKATDYLFSIERGRGTFVEDGVELPGKI